MRTLFRMGPATELGQARPPGTEVAEELCREALTAQMDIENPSFTGDQDLRLRDREAAVDALVMEMKRLEDEGRNTGWIPEIDFQGCRIMFRRAWILGRARLGQGVWGALITAAGMIARSYYEKRAAKDIAETQEEIAEAQARAAEARRAQEEAKATAEKEKVSEEGLSTGTLLAIGGAGAGAVALALILR